MSKNNIKKSIRKTMHGFTMIELMVGMVIGLFATLVIYQVLYVSEGYKRTTTGGSDALQSGSYAIYQLEKYLRMGGSGFATVKDVWGCPLSLPDLSSPSTLPISPVLISDGGTGSDSIYLFSGQHPSIARSLITDSTYSANATSIQITNNYGSANGDWLLGVPVLDDGKPRQDKPCGIGKIGAAVVAGSALTLHTSHTIPVQIGTQAPVANLGTSPFFVQFRIGSDGSIPNSLLIDYLLPTTTSSGTQSMADNIVFMKAIYGIAQNSNDPFIAPTDWVKADDTNWTITALTENPDRIKRLRAIRIAIVARNATQEKKPVPAAISASTPTYSHTLFGDTASAVATYTPPTAERVYRHKVFEITIPLRNMVTMPNNNDL